MSRAGRLAEAFRGGPRLATALLMVAGAGMAVWSAARSYAVADPSAAGVYSLVGLALLALALALLLSDTVAAVIAAVILFASGPAVIAAAAELALGMDAAKADEVRLLGVEPRLALELNLGYFVAAAAIAGWLLARLAGGERRR